MSCTHCSKPLSAGRGELYLVQILAVADPSDLQIDALDAEETGRQINALLKELQHTSDEDAMTQVFRRTIIHLCYPCYRRWIDDPTGAKASGLPQGTLPD